MPYIRRCTFLTFLVICGCQREPASIQPETADSQSTQNRPIEPEVLSELNSVQEQQKAVALKAKDQLFEKLSSRLMEAIQASGPAQAIEVCRAEAPAFAEQVKRDMGVNIGRTSFKLRNAANPPPQWAVPLVQDRVETATFVALDEGQLGAFLPIMLQKKCELCHGPRETIAQDVLSTLDRNYPHDEATGFREGDLRGWFWIEVPAGAVPSVEGE